MHSYRWSTSDTVSSLGWGNGGPWAVGYCFLALLFYYTHWRKENFQTDSKGQSKTLEITINNMELKLPEFIKKLL
jgi:hypothetical protein